MKQLLFHKFQASGNDFVLVDCVKQPKPKQYYQNLAKNLCPRRTAAGADGLLVVEKSRKADYRMLIFNSDGSQAEMCGNGIRCFSLYLASLAKKKKFKIETLAGIVDSEVSGNEVKFKSIKPFDIKLDLPLVLKNRKIKVNFINTGVPHTVVFVSGLDLIDVEAVGRKIRRHRKFAPAGTNVDFVEILTAEKISVRTYERGVEGETLSCGTGIIAGGVVAALKFYEKGLRLNKISVLTRNRENIPLYFDINYSKKEVKEVWMQGRAFWVYTARLSLPLKIKIRR